MRRSKTEKIDQLIQQVLKENNLDGKLKEYELVTSWEKVIGKTVANATTDIYIRNRKLFVKVRSSVIRNELLMIKDGLIKALNREVQANIIDDIIVR
ncbi:DUF721 domain-containing protein [Labilibaculum sp. DW002]|uniref:DUF721 domain-containing protein n=1 Tax=Paralabilibaculum antarcticum TaxID=2912572 RepID=A0ABT5VUL2_9BACT|nr:MULTISPECIES: DUF721 domain-containing protein [unclassified Labilibaculum]MBI9058359.1 DUF721 domain-containing protein [Labilibaculum sp.]MDE5419109.1 DUF721 domain-containing protein [Labilibaculum sp. DW002]